MSIEAMKQARAALEDVITQIKYYEQASEAIVALNRAIEKAEEQAQKQKPLAWMCTETKVLYEHDTSLVDKYHGFKPTVPLYAHPTPVVKVESVKQEPIKFLANSTRFKLSFQDTETDSVGNAGTYVTCFEGWEHELDGRWVALVDAEDGRHFAYSHPTPAVVAQLVDALQVAVDSDLGASWVWPDSAKATWLKNANAALAAAKESGL